jgi:altronate dehydratase
MPGPVQAIIIDPKDNVATAIHDLEAGACIDTVRGEVALVRAIPYGHKFALEAIPRGAYVIKYGAWIGRATAAIPEGDHVHVHNVEDITDEVRKGV